MSIPPKENSKKTDFCGNFVSLVKNRKIVFQFAANLPRKMYYS